MFSMFKFKSIRSRQMFWLSIVGILPVILFSTVFFLQHLNAIKAENLSHLVAIRDLKVQQINQWLTERVGDVYAMSSVTQQYLFENKNTSSHIKNDLRNILKVYRDKYESYEEIFMIDKRSGSIFVSTDSDQENKNKSDDLYFSEVIRTKKEYIKDVYYSDTLNKTSMSFSIPVYNNDIDKEMNYVLVARISLDYSLFKIIKENTAMGATGEILIVNSSALALNELRHSSESSLKLKITALPAVNAANGKTGVIESNDYRNIPVLAAYTYLPRTGWGVISKKDLSQIYGPTYTFVKYAFFITFVFSLFIIAAAVFLSGKLTLPLIRMADVAKRIRRGESGLRNEVSEMDEIGYLALSFNEMSEALEKEKKLLKSHLQNTVDSMPSVLIGIDVNKNIIIWNEQAQELSGHTEEQAVNHNLYDVMLLLKEYDNQISAVILGGDPNIIRKVKFKKGSYKKTYDLTIYPLSEGETIGAVIRIDDITAQLDKDEIIRHSQKMDALGQLTGGVAHDFNNMLGVILGYTELLKLGIDKEDKFYNYVSEIYVAAERAKNLTSKLLNFSRKGGSQDVVVANINDLILGERSMLEKTLTVAIELRVELANEIWPVCIDKNLLEDAVLNMSINSKHAMPDGGVLTITTQNIYIQNQNQNQIDIKPGEYVMLTISDTGHGMSDDVQGRIFDPFYTTKGQGGTGLGLSQVYGFVQQSKGTIHVYSEPGIGTRISLYFPRSDKESGNDKKEIADFIEGDSLNGNETILIVDDEKSLLILASNILESVGYKVFTALNADEALNILSSNSESIELVLTDVIMPKMSGYELAWVIKDKYPKIKIQIVSGFINKSEENYFDQDLYNERLTKPYNKNELLRKLRNQLS
ncbi:MAG: hypothetical protein DIZ80_00575 [endosymbiont of Galathealinum brachiosum]|uniref:histidine kinase n=1 Tax=endosymbiont of Galathealinum brachiosum TaxID=2200906 RepID=A0A370DM68_9GAMM|nr:MAG: hypothetical protein DIZ80_00575 [endosymbiont of Galathealinum brachiosum]